jgi:hypothetical protein
MKLRRSLYARPESVGREDYYLRELADNHEQYLTCDFWCPWQDSNLQPAV